MLIMLIIWCRNVVSMEGCKKKVKKKKSSNKLLVNYLSTSLNQPSNDLFKLRQNIKLSSRLRRNSVFYSYAFLFHEFPLYQRASFLSCSKVTCFLAFHDHFVLRLCKNYSLSLWTLIITGFWILKNSKERRERFARYIGWFITSGILFVAEKYSFASIKNPRKQKKKKKIWCFRARSLTDWKIDAYRYLWIWKLARVIPRPPR